MGTTLCQTCKKVKPDSDFKYDGTGKAPALCKECFSAKRRNSVRIYREKPESKVKLRAYRQKPEVKESIKAARIRYLEKQEVKERIKAREKAYRQKPEVKEHIKARQSAYKQKPGVRERINQRQNMRSKRPDVNEYNRKIQIQYRQNPESKEKLRAYYKKPEVIERKVAQNRNAALTANDRYIKGLIKGKTNGILKAKDVPPELIEAQRQSLLLKRTIKQKNKEDEQHDTTDI